MRDFNSFAKLNRRKSSPLQRLLQDMDACLSNFFECFETREVFKDTRLKLEAQEATQKEYSVNLQCSGQDTY